SRHRGIASFVAKAEEPRLDQAERRRQLRIFLDVSPGLVPVAPQIAHLLHREAAEEEVLGAHRVSDLDVRAVERADGEGAVERELHVARSRSLLARLRDLE